MKTLSLCFIAAVGCGCAGVTDGDDPNTDPQYRRKRDLSVRTPDLGTFAAPDQFIAGPDFGSASDLFAPAADLPGLAPKLPPPDLQASNPTDLAVTLADLSRPLTNDLLSPPVLPQPDLAPPPATSAVWPNSVSRTTSDPWIAQHHREIVQMNPRVLALNFVNGHTNAYMTTLLQQALVGLREGSRYHGYNTPNAPPFLNYSIGVAVDLTDLAPYPSTAPFGYNSTKYPRKPATSTDRWKFNYAALFSQAFADYYRVPDPANPGRNLTLCELLQRGIVHEVWIWGAGVADVSIAEVLEYKQRYDINDVPIPGSFDNAAGNGRFDISDTPTCGLSVRIVSVNSTRGPGCVLHSLGHGFEAMANHSLPSLHSAYSHFSNSDLNTRLGLPFESWYACRGAANCIAYTSSNSLNWVMGVTRGTVNPFNQGCGNVHFPPNARQDYDVRNSYGVLSTCEHFGLHDGLGGTDLQEIYTSAKSDRYAALAPDCEGGWQIYWRQSFPGLNTTARAPDGTPIKNWWPYLFY